MLHHCLTLNPSPSPLTNGHYHYQPQAQADFAADGGGGGGGGETASVASTQPSPNLAREYSNVLQSLSYQEIRSTVEVLYHDQDQNAILERVLNPNRDCVEEALRYAKPNTLTRLVSEYFDHSEYTTQLCLHLQHAVARARELYAPLHDLLQLLPADSDSLSQSHCNWANETFLKFDALHNPFSFPDDTHHNFDHIRGSFSNLRKQLDRRLRKSRSLIRNLFDTAFFSRPVALTTRALTSLVVCTALPMTKKVSRVAQLDAAAKGTYVLHEDLNTIKSLVDRLQSFIEEDKVSVRMGLDSCGERHLIHEVVKQLRKNHSKIVHQLDDLEDHIYLCLNTVNKARLRLLQQIYLHQTSLSGDTRQTEET